MHLSNAFPLASALLLSAAPFALAGNFDSEDVPSVCSTVCEPIRQLVRQCDVDDDRVGGDRNEDLLERQCICENRSFDVANVAGQCQGCIEQHFRDGCTDNDHDDDDDDDNDRERCDDGREDIRDLMRACGFSSVSYDAAATTSVQSISVSATRPTDINQLTTTVSPQETGVLGVDDTANDGNNNNNNGDDEGAAAQGALPGMALCLSGAVAGAVMLL